MKTILISISIYFVTQAALANITKIPIQNAEVIVFDAICTPTSESEGYLMVNLQLNSKDLIVNGKFFSFSESSSANDSKKWYLISLNKCQKAQLYLSKQAGRKLFLKGYFIEEAQDAYEVVWGKCRNHPLEGIGSYPCK